MIKPGDFEFHFKPDSHWQWAETIYFPFIIPEEGISGGAYFMARPMIGMCMADISIHNRISHLWEEQLYIDNQQFMPCPDSLLDFSLPNGLSMKALDPLKHHRVTYTGVDDTRFDLEYIGIHEPFDINDPEMDPLVANRSGPAWDTSWAGHYDATYRVKGELVVRGRRYDVDCVDTGDRSWSPRVERENGNMIWWHTSFGEELTVHLFATHDIANTNDFGPLVSGYVLENGETFGLVECSGTQDYYKALPIGGQVEVTDVRGKKFNFTYSTMNSCYWGVWSSNTFPQALMRVNLNGQISYGTQQMVVSHAYMTRNHDRIVSRY